MKISIFGMGYVGIVSGACLAAGGHEVVGVDVNPVKVNLINEGRSPIIEKDLPGMIGAAVKKGFLRAVTDPAEAVRSTECSFICVGTPGNGNGNQNTAFIRRVCEQIGGALKEKSGYHHVVVRSTLIPGSTEEIVIPILESSSGKKAGRDFGVYYNPEFMREGNSVQDFHHPPMTVIGTAADSGDAGAEPIMAVYKGIDAPLVRTGYRVAETIKYVCNVFHALKIAFANEIGTVCKGMGIDGHEVMDIVCLDSKLNISRAYLKPGFAFGGSCLPKDLRALTYRARELDIETPLLQSILPANAVHVQRTLDLIFNYGRKKIGVIGLSFKPGTDDLRESPMVTLVETLIGKGYPIRVYDRNISMARLTGSNKEFIENEIPHIASILTEDAASMLDWSELVVAGACDADSREALAYLKRDHILVDLARVFNPKSDSTCSRYHGVCW